MTGQLCQGEGRLLLKMARASIGEKLGIQSCDPKDGDQDLGFLKEKRGLFVTLHKKGHLRGCIGTIEPVKPLGSGICENAVCAAFKDYRFPPLTEDEFSCMDIEISLLSIPEMLEYKSPEDLVQRLVPGRDGVIVEKAGCRATFLPQVWEHLPLCDAFLSQLCTKAGLGADAWQKEDLTIYTYGVQSFAEGCPPDL
ncbi:MAG: AmmeMemoRadiSam system protein A [Desulfobacter sp.]|nr:AmmeMemoRadiSam system protein A [Desulfobacter sp.]WDP85987.1 MAG: AmmeMemoRadiSam system protein A [Desulfobacter sp.]